MGIYFKSKFQFRKKTEKSTRDENLLQFFAALFLKAFAEFTKIGDENTEILLS